MYVVKYELKGYENVVGMLQRSGQIPRKRMLDVLNKWRFILASKITSNLSGGVVRRRTGNLLKSVNPHQNLTVIESDDNTYIVAFKNKIAAYGVPLEKGATVLPRTKQFLAVPLLERKGGKARPLPLSRYKNKFFRPSKSNPEDVVVYWRKAKAEKPVPIYVLKKKVELPSYPWFSTAVEEAMPNLRALIRGE